MPGVISYPIPPYQNLPIHPEYFIPSRFAISAIALGETTTITTAVNHDYVIGQEIRLIIPNTYGSRGLNDTRGIVLSIPALNQVQLNINSIGVDPFILASSLVTQPTVAQIIAIGDYNNGAINSHGRVMQITYIPGSFRNISPL